jgi:cell shape-determining protein MreD
MKAEVWALLVLCVVVNYALEIPVDYQVLMPDLHAIRMRAVTFSTPQRHEMEDKPTTCGTIVVP